ncbi:SDR family NAD(P)-dependent oxidoreductase [Zeaxanthinibacter enoshimensis]|uniref:NAD(P)-dependent dehydrogenase (Short-subunit alcohol dehydrogenase family) n=1 Tax=Zeaxanthinibacter enoshimensis TaxID=392009 RepID=A0A4R6TMI8_9FLAO|nr:SDR family oxidoreductase [Zeaxanthinibacter enoshimensis]TDQ31068.1 NAD(P)-dependent dehydrogenase (short-subunit alcohol dehydrogenase family) [Zeaxanthinibacter enoshimensis]
MNRLSDKVAIITGGAGGIGLATAKLFLEQGARVMLVDLDQETLENIHSEMNHEHLAIFAADVSDAEDTRRFIDKTLDVFGGIDIFFANAGIEGTSSPIAEYPDDIYDRVLAVNLKGVWLGCKHVIPRMYKGGSVIMTSSVAGLKGFPGLGAYVASKHAVVGLMRVAALEFASQQIRVNSIHPGPVNNQMMRRIEEEINPEDPAGVIEGFEASIPFRRYADSSEIAEMALFLASDESKYITGCTHIVDGGMMAQ